LSAPGPVVEASARRRRLVIALAVAAIIITIDQVTKTLAVDHLSSGPVHVIGPLSLELAFNSGVAFSLGTGDTLPIILVAIGLIVVVFWFLRGAPSNTIASGLGLVLGGAIGNLADRLFRGRHGAVVDFIHVGFWPTFNVADTSIVCGCVVLVIGLARSEFSHPGASR
jgi:signal peptidase II